METTRYFREQVLRKRPYIQLQWCEKILSKPISRVVQPDGRIRFWGIVPELGNRILRVVICPMVRLHNAFPDRDFTLPSAEQI